MATAFPAPLPSNGPNGTGASDLILPFVNGTNLPYQIIRRPPPGEATTSLLGGSRLANEAQIRVLLSDKEADLHLPGWNGDVTQDVELASAVPPAEFANTAGPFATTGGAQSGIIVNGNTYYFGESACGAGSVGNACTQGDTKFVVAAVGSRRHHRRAQRNQARVAPRQWLAVGRSSKRQHWGVDRRH